MKYRMFSLFAALPVLAVAMAAQAGECDDPVTNEEVSYCIGVDLRDADSHINTTYKELRKLLNEAEKNDLRDAQRAWIKERDATCALNTKETDREKWYIELLRDYPKTICVIRYTRQRTEQLDEMLVAKSMGGNATPAEPAPAPAPAAVADAFKAYDGNPISYHTKGKWYFEMNIDRAAVVKIGASAITAGVEGPDKVLTGMIGNVRKQDADKGIIRLGFAIDLDNGKVYYSENGTWVVGEPGSNRGMDVKLGRDYNVAYITSADSLAPYIEAKAIATNFGEAPMAYALPGGYRPWRDRL